MIVVRPIAFVLIALVLAGSPLRAAYDPRLIKPREVTAGELVPLAKSSTITGAANDDGLRQGFCGLWKERGVHAVIGGENTFESRCCASKLRRRGVLDDNKIIGDGNEGGGATCSSPRKTAWQSWRRAGREWLYVQTLKQLVRLDGGQAHPDRGDPRLARDAIPRLPRRSLARPVPTLEFQKRELRTFAAYKINVCSPCTTSTRSSKHTSNPLSHRRAAG